MFGEKSRLANKFKKLVLEKVPVQGADYDTQFWIKERCRDNEDFEAILQNRGDDFVEHVVVLALESLLAEGKVLREPTNEYGWKLPQ